MTTVIVTGLLMLVGLVGIVVPVLPGLLLVWLATALWAFDHPNRWAWLVFALCGVVYAAGLVTQYLVPGRRLKDAGVKTSTLFLAVILAIVGFFVIPVVGIVVGFVLGVYLAELLRLGPDRAGPATVSALKAVGVSIMIEFLASLAAAATWAFGLLLV